MSERQDQQIRRPEPTAEPPAPPPGGPHAVPGVGGEGPYTRIPRDPDPAHNPETEHQLPDETTEPEDTETEATEETEGTLGDAADSEPA